MPIKFDYPLIMKMEVLVLTDGSAHRHHANEVRCGVCGLYEWDWYPHDRCSHTPAEGSRELLAARKWHGEAQRKSEHMANRWPFGRRALQ